MKHETGLRVRLAVDDDTGCLEDLVPISEETNCLRKNTGVERAGEQAAGYSGDGLR